MHKRKMKVIYLCVTDMCTSSSSNIINVHQAISLCSRDIAPLLVVVQCMMIIIIMNHADNL